MQSYIIDQGKQFGKWNDSTSEFMYYNSLHEIKHFLKINSINTDCSIGDYGGGNGILKSFFNNVTTIDEDYTKNPDIVDNILTHNKYYDLVILRYVLHYLNDYELIELFENINAKNILIIQFTNEDLKTKYFNSRNEIKYFRNEAHLKSLIPTKSELIYSKEYLVKKDFYINRIGDGEYLNHYEKLNTWYI